MIELIMFIIGMIVGYLAHLAHEEHERIVRSATIEEFVLSTDEEIQSENATVFVNNKTNEFSWIDNDSNILLPHRTCKIREKEE